MAEVSDTEAVEHGIGAVEPDTAAEKFGTAAERLDTDASDIVAVVADTVVEDSLVPEFLDSLAVVAAPDTLVAVEDGTEAVEHDNLVVALLPALVVEKLPALVVQQVVEPAPVV